MRKSCGPILLNSHPSCPFYTKKNKIRLATAKKGGGKSALLRWIEISLRESSEDYVVILCKGRDLVRTNFSLSGQPSTPNEYINDWISRICCVVARQLGKELGIALDDDAISLVEAAELAGEKKRNLISAVVDRMKGVTGSIERKRLEVANYEELLVRVLKKKVWFLVDDLDATYQRTDRENLELSTFFSACRYLSTTLSEICFRVTMRTDVWTMLRRYDESLDKVDQYVSDITWSQSEFRKLLFKRIAAQVHDLKIQLPPKPEYVTEEEEQEYYVDLVFEKRMKWGESEKRTYKVIYTLAYHRPRWAIQLCKSAQVEAIAEKSDVIQREHIDEVWAGYGKKRIADLVSEHKHQCRTIEELISAFRGAERRMNRDKLLDWIKNTISNHMTPVIEGVPTKVPLEIAHFLFRIGFIVARAEEGKDDYEHYHFSDMPDFLSSRTNQDFGAIWEIHPCYREALDIVKLNRWQKKHRNQSR